MICIARDRPEAERLIQAHGYWVADADAQAEGRQSLSSRLVDQPDEQGPTDASSAHFRNDGDRQLRDVFADEAVTGLVPREVAIPRGPDGLAVSFGYHPTVPWSSPVDDVPRKTLVLKDFVERGFHLPRRKSGMEHHFPKEVLIGLRRRPYSVHRFFHAGLKST
ncbi:MAG TPA: hypothetical protein VGQ02_02685 [Candidatus Limnocylindrales bacterium]|nr:hypothetical protein [Candidatus Limnocylindrales bacterium]